MHPRRWQKLKLIWVAVSELTNWTIDYGLLWLYVYIHRRFSLFFISFLTGFMICSISCSTCSSSTKWAKVPYFVWEKFYFIQKLKFLYYNNLFGNVFETSGVIGLIMLLYRNSDAKNVFQLLEKVFSSLAFHWKPGFYNFSVISMF